MSLFLLEWLNQHGFKVPTAFGYYSTRMILALLTSFVITIFFGPFFINWLKCLKIGQSIRKEECPTLGKLHEKKENTPTMGGILLIVSLLISLLIWMDLSHLFTWILFFVTLSLGFLGGIDDYMKIKLGNTKGLSAKKKLIVQFVLSGLVACYLIFPTVIPSKGPHLPIVKEESAKTQLGDKNELATLPFSEYVGRIYFPFFKKPIVVLSGAWLILGALFTVVVITGSSNAVNLTDGLDGLATGCLMMVACCLSIVAFLSNHVNLAGYLNILYIEGSGEIAIYLSAFVGVCLGFLWYNGYPAQVFMGDTGSLTLGGILGVSAVLLKREFLLAIIGGIFVMEALSVMIQVISYRYRQKKRVFLCAPLHHHFEYKGWPETRVVMRFWIVGLVLALVGIVSLKLQ